MNRVQTTAATIRQIEFELDKAEHGLARSSTTATRDVRHARRNPAVPVHVTVSRRLQSCRAAAEFDTSTGRAKGANATAEILLPIAAVAIGDDSSGIGVPYHCKRRRWSMANVAGSRRA